MPRALRDRIVVSNRFLWKANGQVCPNVIGSAGAPRYPGASLLALVRSSRRANVIYTMGSSDYEPSRAVSHSSFLTDRLRMIHGPR